ncbi:hypothetical protein A9Q99_22830 [Gammaproteobacteria bacterium 45_16_T64]|nr:hypothetical protein A9Q99_22830 [Gammaproteobacteria bacterium 45_16_T64]
MGSANSIGRVESSRSIQSIQSEQSGNSKVNSESGEGRVDKAKSKNSQNAQNKVDEKTTRLSVDSTQPVSKVGQVMAELDNGFNGTLELEVPLEHNVSLKDGVRTASGALLRLTVEVKDGKIDLTGGDDSNPGIKGEIDATNKSRVALKKSILGGKAEAMISKLAFEVKPDGSITGDADLKHATASLSKMAGAKNINLKQVLDMNAVNVEDGKLSVSDFYKAFQSQQKLDAEKASKEGSKTKAKSAALTDVPNTDRTTNIRVQGSWPNDVADKVKKIALGSADKPSGAEANAGATNTSLFSNPLAGAHISMELAMDKMDVEIPPPTIRGYEVPTVKAGRVQSDGGTMNLDLQVGEDNRIDLQASRITIDPPLKCSGEFGAFGQSGKVEVVNISEIRLEPGPDGEVRFVAENDLKLGFMKNKLNDLLNKKISSKFEGGKLMQDLSENNLKKSEGGSKKPVIRMESDFGMDVNGVKLATGTVEGHIRRDSKDMEAGEVKATLNLREEIGVKNLNISSATIAVSRMNVGPETTDVDLTAEVTLTRRAPTDED